MPSRAAAHVHQPLHRQRDRRPRHAAIGRHRAGVGGDAARADLVLADVVGAGELGHRHQRLDPAGDRIAGIGPDIAADIGLDGEQPAVGVEGAADDVALVAAVERGREVLAPVLDPGQRAAELPRRPDEEDVFRDQRHLLAEAAADIRRDDAKVALGHAEAIGDAGAEHVRHLGRAGQRHPAGAPVEGGEAAARLERHGVLPARADVDLDHRRGVGDRFGEALGLDLALDQDIAGGVGHGRAGAPGASAASRSTTASSGSMSTKTCSAMSSASSRRRRDHGRDRLAGEGDGVPGEDRLGRPARSRAGGGAGGCRRRRQGRRR